jgi:glycosyltransferase involved in cell wall biosynthesis
MKKSIALLHYSVPPVVGGVESVIGHHARLLADAGYRVRLLAGRGESSDPRIEFIPIPLLDSMDGEILAAKKVLDRGEIPAQFDALVGRILVELSRHTRDIDVLIAHNVASLHKNLPLTAALKEFLGASPALKGVLWHHDLAWTTPRYRSELYDGYPWSLLRQPWPGVKQVVVSRLRQKELADLLGLPAEEIVVVPNGVDLARFLKLEPITCQWLASLPLLDAAPLLLLPVRITRRKNIELALRVLASLKNRFPAARLVITGPLGPHNPANLAYFDRLRALRSELGLEGQVFFLAEQAQQYLPDAVVADFYRLADALLFPSREEGFGIPILEAGLAGIPIFCSDIAPLRELVGENGWYFSPDDSAESVADLLYNHLLADHAFSMRFKTRQTYSWEQVFRLYIDPLLQELS